MMTDKILQKRIDEVRQMHYDGTENKHFHNTGVGGYLRDFVLGANDGIITTFAVVSGVAGANLAANVVLIMGFANIFADGISMAMSNYLGEKSDLHFIQAEKEREAWEIEHLPEEERKEIRELYAAKGFKGELLDKVVNTITADKKLWVKEMMLGEHGLLSDDVDTSQPWKNGLVTFFAFVLAGLVPLLPYLLGWSASSTFPLAVAATVVTQFVIGSLRSLITGRKWWVSGFEMLGVGIAAAAAAYAVGSIIGQIV